MNIGVFLDTYYPQINGVATSTMMLKKELTRRGHKVYIFTTTDPRAEKNQPGVFRLPSLPFIFLPTHRMTLLYPPKILMGMKRFKLDIVHTQTEFSLGVFGKLVSTFYKVPLVHTYHTMYEDYVHYIAKGRLVSVRMAQRLSRIFCNSARAVITPVEKSRDKLIEYGVRRPIHIIPTGIDFEPFAPERYTADELLALKAELGISATDPVMVSVGRVAQEKSMDVLVRQMPAILARIPDMKLVIVGDGPSKNSLVALAKELDVAGAVIFTGAKPWRVIGKYYLLGDVFVCASTSETQGLTYIEAMAAKVPAIVKRDPSVDGLIEHGVTGYYFDKDEDAAAIIIEAFSNRQRLKAIAEVAFGSIRHLSLQQFGDSLEAVYRAVIEADAKDKAQKKAARKPRLPSPAGTFRFLKGKLGQFRHPKK